jgi:hypothetical protein
VIISSFVNQANECEGDPLMNSKKLLALLGAAGVVAHVGAIATVPAKAAASNAQLERILQEDPTSQDAGDAFNMLASRFKDKGDKGRPGAFGNPGPPDTGPPGHYSG